jgi:hypothetical protein
LLSLSTSTLGGASWGLNKQKHAYDICASCSAVLLRKQVCPFTVFQECFPFSISHLHLLRGLLVQFYNELGAHVSHVHYLPLLVAMLEC